MPGRRVDHQAAEHVVPGRETRRDTAQQGMSDQHRPLGVSLREQVLEPVGEHSDVEPVGRRRLTKPGYVRHNYVVNFGEASDDRRPVGTAAFNATMQQNERWSLAGFEHRGADACGIQPPSRDGQPGEHLATCVPSRRSWLHHRCLRRRHVPTMTGFACRRHRPDPPTWLGRSMVRSNHGRLHKTAFERRHGAPGQSPRPPA